LLNSFDHIYVLDLHGNAKKKEKCPDGSRDQNVFDIQQGVAIILAVKKNGLKKTISHADLWGLREHKYNWLVSNDMKTTKWKKLTPSSEFYFFVIRDERLLGRYQKYSKITDILPTNSVGVVTSRDKFVIDAGSAELKKRIRMFRDENIPDSMIKQAFNLRDKTNWKVKTARKKVTDDENWEKQVIPILYRPFDQQWVFYNDAVVERTRKEVMRNMMHENVALLSCRQQNKVGFYHALVSDTIVESCIVSDRTREISYVFPLYLYPDEDLYNNNKMNTYHREVNIDKQVFDKLKTVYKTEPKPEGILHYIYAILYSNIFRQKYAEFLKSDFPRIPFSADLHLFRAIAKLGKDLVYLHLMKSKKLDKPFARFEGKGDRLVQKIKYNQKKRLIYINEGQHFGPVSKDIWEYQIGGYQVMDKWLKDRKNHRLSLDAIKHYCRIATAIKQTIGFQKKIDELYSAVDKNFIRI